MKESTVINRVSALETAADMIKSHLETGGHENEDTPTGSLAEYEKACLWAFDHISKMADKYKLMHPKEKP